MPSYYDSDHPYEVLLQGRNHRIVFCYECQLYHVHYGTSSIDLTATGLKMLANDLTCYLAIYDGVVEPDDRCVEVETPAQGIRLLLSTEELHILRGLLYQAHAKFEEHLRLRRLN